MTCFPSITPRQLGKAKRCWNSVAISLYSAASGTGMQSDSRHVQDCLTHLADYSSHSTGTYPEAKDNRPERITCCQVPLKQMRDFI